MNDFEQNLRDALERREPPAGFAERVMVRVSASGPRRRRVWAGWVAAAALVLAAGLFIESERAERARGEQAKQEVLLALRVAGRTLNQVEDYVRRAQPLRIEQN